MKTKSFLMIITLLTLTQGAWAQTTVTTDEALRSAITSDASIKLGANIDLDNNRYLQFVIIVAA